MKLFSFVRLGIFCVLLLLVISCSSDNKDDSGKRSSDEFVIASVETLSFKSSNIPNGVTASKIDSSVLTTYLVQGIDNAGNALVLTIAKFDGVGTYNFNFDEDSNDASGLFSNQITSWSSSAETGGSGRITVLTDTATETTGTFNFIGVQGDMVSSTRTITNGSFRAKYNK